MDPSMASTKDEANKLLRYEHLAHAKGWCDYTQRQWLQRNLGVSGRGLPKSKGAVLARAWLANGKQPARARIPDLRRAVDR